jgi:hypothetical protein
MPSERELADCFLKGLLDRIGILEPLTTVVEGGIVCRRRDVQCGAAFGRQPCRRATGKM